MISEANLDKNSKGVMFSVQKDSSTMYHVLDPLKFSTQIKYPK